MDLREEMRASYRRAYAEYPGLETFDRWKKRLLWGVFLLAAALKLVSMLPMIASGASVFALALGALVGLGIPGILALAVYRGPWTLSLVLLLPAASAALDLVQNGFPLLSAGESYIPLFYILLALESLYCLCLLGLAAWLALPAQNREFAQVLSDISREFSQRIKEMNNAARR